MKGEDGSRAPWMVMQTWKERRTGAGKKECPVCLPSYTSSGIQDNWILRQEAGLENRKISKSTLISTTSPSSDLRSRIYIKVPRSTVQHELDRYIISVCGMFFSVPTVVTSHVAWPNIQSDLRSSIPRSSVPVNPESRSEGLRSNVFSVSKISITVVV